MAVDEDVFFLCSKCESSNEAMKTELDFILWTAIGLKVRKERS